LVTVTIAVIGLLFGARNPGIKSWWLRVPAIVVAFFLSVLVYWYIYIRTMRPRSKKKR
jgi:O-antigen/teichoic acid export membrane protein